MDSFAFLKPERLMMQKWIRTFIRVGLFTFIALLPFLSVQAGSGSLITDFENGVPYAVDANGNALGLVPWGSDFENVTLSARQVVPGGKLAFLSQGETGN